MSEQSSQDGQSKFAAAGARPAAPPGKALRDAATVMLLRDGDTGLEVFMLRRTLNAAFVGGFYVFPGGVVDPADRAADVEAGCIGLTDAVASDRLGIDGGGLAYWVAAVRECFEEAGVLLARDQHGDTVSFTEPATAARFGEHRHAVHGGTLRLAEMCAHEGLRLETDAIAYVSHWITPVGEPRRFDTRFFVARAPLGQEPLHDDSETIASLWINPATAIDQATSGELQMIVPTMRNLEFLAPHDSCDAVMAVAHALGHPPTILPRIVRRGESIAILLPDDPAYDDADEVDVQLMVPPRG